MLTLVRYLSFGLLLFSSVSFAVAQTTIRQVDFKNFTYPWSEPTGWPHQVEWLDTAGQKHVRLVNGRWRLDAEDQESSPQFSGLTLEEVRFDDVTGKGLTDAIVVLRFDTGGTQYSHYVYIYAFVARKPKLLAWFHSGDRAYAGLYRVYGQDGKLVIELFDPDKRSGDCCSTGFVRRRYQWHGGDFEVVGNPEFGTPKVLSRLRVNLFGMHQ
jgi:hypothetical protein